jgi:hypothetical protein
VLVVIIQRLVDDFFEVLRVQFRFRWTRSLVAPPVKMRMQHP